MNTLVIVLIAAVLLSCAYVFYGRWLANKWGIDPKAETPAKKFEDGKDYVPTDGWTVFSHQFSSIAGAGPVTGAIQAAVFGWVPVFLWIIVGGIFFGAVTDFGALYASVKNEGKSMGLLIEKYIGKFGRKVFLLFCWLFTLLVIAAFADMVAGTFNAYRSRRCRKTCRCSKDKRSCRNHFPAVYRICYDLWSGTEKIPVSRMERNSCRSCIYSSCSWSWYVSTDHSNKRYMDLHYICIYLLYSSTSDVDLKAAS